jgi:hypothetical protein
MYEAYGTMDMLTTNHANIALAAISLAVGLAFALLAWLVSRTLAEVPPEDRSYKDTPPLGFRLLWAPISWIAHFIGPRLPAHRHARLLVRLGQAGVDFAVNPAQFLASRMLGALFTGLIFAGCWRRSISRRLAPLACPRAAISWSFLPVRCWAGPIPASGSMTASTSAGVNCSRPCRSTWTSSPCASKPA